MHVQSCKYFSNSLSKAIIEQYNSSSMNCVP